MKNLRRRYALYYLKQEEKPVELGELAEQVAAWENDTTVDSITAEQRKSVYSALYQTHLPKLEEAGVITYDRRQGVVSFSQEGRDLDIYLASDPQATIPWNRFYLGLSVAGLAGTGFKVLDAAPLAMLTDLEWTLLVLVAFLVAGLAHTYDVVQWRRRFEGAAPDFLLEFNHRN